MMRVGTAVEVLGGPDRRGMDGVDLDAVADVSVTRRGDQWWMVLGGTREGSRVIGLYEATLPAGTEIASTEWSIVASDGVAIALVEPPAIDAWDSSGYHCATYASADGVERIYYAGSRDPLSLFGPYSIGVIELVGGAWQRRSEPVLQATEAWECGTVLEPYVWFSDGRWRMWYCAGASEAGEHRIGFAESVDGISWTKSPPDGPVEEFDRVELADGHLSAHHPSARQVTSDDGLWITTTGDRTQLVPSAGVAWHNGGVWKPSVVATDDGFSVFFNAAAFSQSGFSLAVGRVDVAR